MTFLFSPESRCPPIVVLSEGDEPRRGTVCWRWDSSAAQEGAIHLFPLFGLDIEEFPGPGWLWGVNPDGRHGPGPYPYTDWAVDSTTNRISN